MKQATIIASFILAVSTAFAADTPPQGKGPGQNFDKMKSEVISRINARISRNQEELSCVQAAKDHADLKACREKFMGEMKGQRGPGRQN